MKKNYFDSLILGVLCLTITTAQSQNILFDGDFSETTEIIPFYSSSPPLNAWAYWVNLDNGAQANPTVVDGTLNFEIISPGLNMWDVQLAQWGFSLIQGHSYRLSFDVKADAFRYFGVFLGEEGGDYTNLIGYDRYFNYATTQWQTISIDFRSTSVFALNKLSFELGNDVTTTYFDNVILQDLGPTPPDKVVIAGTFQSALNCGSDWDPNCDFTELTFNSSTGLYTGTFLIPEGNNRYKVAVGGSWDINYGENGILFGADIFLCLPSGPEEITFTYDPSTNLVTTSPLTSGFSPNCLPMVVLAGSFQDELGCYSDWIADCTNSALLYNSDSGLFEGDFNIPSGCHEYRVVLENSWQISYGQEGIFNGLNYILYIPENPESIHFTYDPFTHVVTSSPYSGAPQEATNVSLIGSLQDELGCAYDGEYECNKPALILNSETGMWEGSFTVPAGCYSYRVKETFGCNIIFYGENGIEWGNELQLFIPEDGEINFSYNPQTHILSSSPYSGAPQEVTKVSLTGSLQDELGCGFDYDYECDNPALVLNADSGMWEGSFTLPAGCYSFWVKETFSCNIVGFYGENGSEWGSEIQLYVPEEGEITFIYDPQTHNLISTPFSGAPQEITKVSLMGTLQDELGCGYDYYYECDKPALVLNADSGMWEGSFTLPAGCYSFGVKETFGCNIVSFYGENGIEWGNAIQLYVPVEGEITFIYDTQTHILVSTPYSGAPQEITKVSLTGSLQDELGCGFDFDYECDKPALVLNAASGLWEGSFTLPAGCYSFRVKETFGCNNISFYGENGIEWGNEIQLYIPEEGEITFIYDPQTHILISTPYSGAPQEITQVSLIGDLQDELGCDFDYFYYCDKPALVLNADSGLWEGSFTLPAGCYSFWVKETFGCNMVSFYGENGTEWGSALQLYVPAAGEITFIYDPQTHVLISTPFTDVSTANQCPANISVNNTPGLCGAIVDYPAFMPTFYCGGEIISITQTEGLSSGSLFPVGTTTNTFVLTKITGEEETCSFEVVVTDAEAPVISNLNQVYEPLWPPNHKMVPVFIEYLALDNCNISSTELFISSNEPQTGEGSGDFAPDWEVLDEHNVLLRAERSGKGNGREYYITIRVTDSSDNFTEQFVTVRVLHDKGKKSEEYIIPALNEDKYILYPNAADAIINIKGPKPITNSAYIIYDMLGVIKKQGTLINEQVEVETLQSGVYIIKFDTDTEYIHKKFIKN